MYKRALSALLVLTLVSSVLVFSSLTAREFEESRPTFADAMSEFLGQEIDINKELILIRPVDDGTSIESPTFADAMQIFGDSQFILDGFEIIQVEDGFLSIEGRSLSSCRGCGALVNGRLLDEWCTIPSNPPFRPVRCATHTRLYHQSCFCGFSSNVTIVNWNGCNRLWN